MDIFDLNCFFSISVPQLAVKCPLLLYSCVALSAKALARVNGRKCPMGGQITPTRQSQTEKWPGPPMTVEAWFHRARQYYDLAVSLLRQALAGASRPPTSSLPEEASPNTISNAQRIPLPTTDSDELVAAIAILCVYEFFDVSEREWGRHLDGAKSLFDIANDRMADLTRPQSPIDAAEQITRPLLTLEPPRSGLGKGLRAVFWCFVRQDMLAAFINHTLTRVDTSDMTLWRSAGLKFNPEGFIYPSNPQHPDFNAEFAMSDDMVSNAFIWLLAKLVNFVIAPEITREDLSPLSVNARQKEMLESWESLDAQLRGWYEGLPDSFNPTAISVGATDSVIEEKWFPRPMCASTMQWWHFARIQLLHNKPHFATPSRLESSHFNLSPATSGTSLAQRHASYASILRQSREHAKEIVSIGLGRSDEGTRVHAVQPLWTAGQVLGTGEDDDVDPETEMWRRSILGQLRGIERDMGWASE